MSRVAARYPGCGNLLLQPVSIAPCVTEERSQGRAILHAMSQAAKARSYFLRHRRHRRSVTATVTGYGVRIIWLHRHAINILGY